MTGRLRDLTRAVMATITIAIVSTVIIAPAAWADSSAGSDGVDIGVTGNGGNTGSGSGSIDTSIGAGNDGSSAGTGGAGSGPSSNVDVSTGGNTDTPPPDLCGEPQLISPPPPADDPQWGGADPETHDVYAFWCTRVILGGGAVPVSDIVVTGKGEEPAPPPPDPADLASQVWGQMRTAIPVPDPTTAPDFRTSWNPELRSPVAWVNVWNWVWAAPDVWRPLTDTLSVRGVSVTVTAQPVALRVDPGDGSPVVECPAESLPGVAYYPQVDNLVDPSRDPNGAEIGGCGWKYMQATSRRNPLQATLFIDWDASWTSNTGESDDLGEVTTFRDTESFLVAERRIVLVPNDRGEG